MRGCNETPAQTQTDLPRGGGAVEGRDKVNAWRFRRVQLTTAPPKNRNSFKTNDPVGRPRANSDTWRNTALTRGVWKHFPLHFLSNWLSLFLTHTLFNTKLQCTFFPFICADTVVSSHDECINCLFPECDVDKIWMLIICNVGLPIVKPWKLWF